VTKILNAPNILTFTRLILACVLFAILWMIDKSQAQNPSAALTVSLVLFIVATLTDALDGYIAREFGLTTVFGRIADPFVDKILVCGCFIFLIPFEASYDRPYVAVVVIAREFLVSGLRSFIEGRGKEFGAIMWGKAKVVVQYSFIAWDLFYLANLRGNLIAIWFTIFAAALLIIVTIASGIAYVIKAVQILSSEEHA
jgi:CDP-diacylglycerol--glycerol-3-phosphate 3-phosphatidyltransferase